jgi:hypothetical protein
MSQSLIPLYPAAYRFSQSFIDLSAVCDAYHTDELRRVVDDVHYAPIAIRMRH